MPWCPKCSCEYEDGVLRCADCDVDLVSREEDIVDWQLLVKAKRQEDADEVMDYLKYSGMEKVNHEVVEDEEMEESMIAIYVSAKDMEKARKCLKGYMMSKAVEKQEAEAEQEDDEEEIVNAYETENFQDDTLVKDLKSSTYTFGIVGVALLIASVLTFTEVITISFSDRYLFSGLMLVIALSFIGVAIHSGKRISSETAHMTNRDQSISDMLSWFETNHDPQSYLTASAWYQEGMDEGAIYYKMMDQLKEEMSKQFPDKEQKIVNSAAEIIFEKMMNDR
ncbi:hypothetical protein HZI73_19505 [Vallitalea pronyensis]|uniref:DUF2007 domain-containing protein n=1 Tax=Vallitalea pronyensis TaxID=1348613 RepID=A0A8J8MM23_9FIRM|nr:hypothetical protein [Vallitalea pronyensis]QUI24347.1 hypothetical protein HZI73_19505 [Vallitalea pronyensis]